MPCQIALMLLSASSAASAIARYAYFAMPLTPLAFGWPLPLSDTPPPLIISRHSRRRHYCCRCFFAAVYAAIDCHCHYCFIILLRHFHYFHFSACPGFHTLFSISHYFADIAAMLILPR
jgi:hypothetical protein